MIALARFRSALIPGLALAVLLIAAFGAPLFAPYDPTAMDIIGRNKPPSADHWLGQDNFGRDIFSRLLYGARVSLTVAMVSAAIAMLIGVTLGLIGGYFRGLSEILTLRVVDIVLSFPPILLALLVVTLFGPGVVTLTACLSILFAPGFARVTYGEVLSIRKLEYVEATRALGARSGRIILGTVLPNVAGPIIVQISLTIASAVLIESGLSFLGLGVVPPAPSWGLMIREARGTMSYTSLPLIWPCLSLIVTVLVFNALCDGLRDVFDPRRKTARAAPAPVPFDPITPDPDAILHVNDLRTWIATPSGVIPAVDGVSFRLRPGETLAIVGESGSGKSMTGLSLMGLQPPDAGRIVSGNIWLKTRAGDHLDLAQVDEETLRRIRGDEIAMIFQEPMTALNPVYRIGYQIAEAVMQHRDIDARAAWALAVETLDKVGVPEPALRARAYPHELSGGLRQRAMIAMALALEPKILIADEPTTALDVTIQAQILDLLRRLMAESEARPAMVFITHDLGVVAEIADRVMVFYAGRVVEEGTVAEVFTHPCHPYTRGLLDSAPIAGKGGRLRAIDGAVPNPLKLPPGCAFAPRCPLARDICRSQAPDLIDTTTGHSRCHFWQEVA
ncbi:MAG: dipeptide/oligopeptide/nickel ABC transporter permease/ATP-binding protein [Proteobacteria bacterium]|nr:dipeptide/oligopeptide/nickel ABC transporter permease/ATP-binding protein [Pseudomonadota bacterium]